MDGEGNPGGALSLPPSVSGPFLTIPRGVSPGGADAAEPPTTYNDIAVLAFPEVPTGESRPRVIGSAELPPDATARLADGDLTRTVDLPRDNVGGAAVRLDLGTDQIIRSATVFVVNAKAGPFGGTNLRARVETSLDNQDWHGATSLTLGSIPTTVAFAPIHARYVRLILEPEPEALAVREPDLGTVLGSGTSRRDTSPIRIAEFQVSGEMRVDRFEAKAGFSIINDYSTLPTAIADDVPAVTPTQVINLTDRLRRDGTLDWTPPPGRWTVLRLGWSLTGATNHPASPDATGLEVDKYDALAVRRYIDTYLDRYRDVVGKGLIGARGITALLTDSIEAGPSNWTPGLLTEFRNLRGYDPTPWLPVLTGTIVGTRAQSDAFLYDYRRTLSDLVARSHYGTIADAAHLRGMRVYGEALEDGRPSLGDDLAMRSYADIPMGAMWSYSRRAGPRATFIADDKGASSIAHLLGRQVVAAESFTSLLKPWASSPADLKRVVDLELALGINRPIIHTSVHQPVDDKLPGLSLAIFGQYFTRHETWAEMARPWMDYITRSSFMLQQGHNVADVAYFYGDDTPLTGLYAEHVVPDAPRGNAYDFIDADTLRNVASVDNGDVVTPGGARYRAIYLGGSSTRMTLTTLRRVADLVAKGATVIGTAPTGSPAMDDATAYRTLVARLWSGRPETKVGQGHVIASQDVDAALRSIDIAHDLDDGDGGGGIADLLFVHRRLSSGHLYFVSNRANQARTVEARFRVSGYAPSICRADTGICVAASWRRRGNRTIVSLPFEAEESLFVIFRKRADAPSGTVRKLRREGRISLNGPWQVAFQPGRGAPNTARFDHLASLAENDLPGIRYFSGISTYTTTFTLPLANRSRTSIQLDLGSVGDLAAVRVNGIAVGTVWHAPYRLEIDHAVHVGTNRIEVDVANLWVNRLIGDAQPGAKPITWTALPTYRADAPLRKSGLIGPVTVDVAD